MAISPGSRMNRLSLAFRRIAAPLSGSKWWVWRLLEFHRTETSPMALFQGNHLDEEDGVHGHITRPCHRQALPPWLALG